ncbi:OprD family porin [Pseudomonas benzenivorans]|uniref:OprD family porin n=1 Tax=Pseudomonas benzenivorans TaxID=556533 RepID=A0ABZ0PZ67_9PSED|nr:OprD family porin [Pseudomonas benzenivorans]WPC06231.1 OprD family porin [Pseudomonas benzenivorans]
MTPRNRMAALLILGTSLPGLANAEFVGDSKGSLELRNFYFNRDFRQDNAASNKAEEWAQGFILRLESGYTEGPVGFGIDAVGMLGLKLDSGDGTAGSALLPADRSGGSQDEYSKLDLTAKLKASNSTLRVGSLAFRSPIASSNDSRLLPGSFRGALLNVQEVDNLVLQGGQIDRVKANNSTNYTEMSARRIGGTSDSFVFGGGDYKLTPELTAGLHYGKLEDVYQQYYGTLVYLQPLGEGQSFKADLRYAKSQEDGSFRDIDNTAFGAMFTYTLDGHAFGAGYQRMGGDDPFPYISDSDPYLVNFVQINDFANTDERSWQVRYDYNFAAVGIPGLTFMTRYISGDNIRVGASGNEKEWERNTDLAYVIQDGPLKNLGIKWRNATVRSTFGNDINENRLILNYTLPLW